ncbi:hypothetical protein SISNIDRAFT_457608 [Sistotremastrum niveocremeum HHB9708]|uniref:SGF29 C-terminal domain-containing protein n=2 Tax=Sistotremastraceae TaxID=3402574 RepID=A0A164RDE9_9AGAM|nr:hypothetical protein SISNIDRAFT_457608 [Sistotremastrum niveocremeum HHB9708]KZT34366.1 hypothetical protein SISSUDRAFT_1052922 [Sistotremastrum suecicum HHB10207 ss-3]
MDRRRTLGNRPLTSEELRIWSQATERLAMVNAAMDSAAGHVGRTNQLIEEVSMSEPSKSLYKKLHSSLQDTKNAADDEVKAIGEALEHVQILVALRRSSDTQQEKRAKRVRLSSPMSGTASVDRTPPPSTLSQSRTGQGQPASTFAKDAKSRRDALNAQLPLQAGRKVAFHPPASKNAGEGKDGDGGQAETDWILAVVKGLIPGDKKRAGMVTPLASMYEVQDVEGTEDGQPGQTYRTSLRSLIPLPDPTAPVGSPSHPSSYEEFPVGSTVMGLYPDTSCFYKAKVIHGPKDFHGPRNAMTKNSPMYRLQFEDDDEQVRPVAGHLVVEWPGQ